MRPVDKGKAPDMFFKTYQDALPYLEKRIGAYCSFCEFHIQHVPEVEHREAKSQGGEELEWENLLLSCKYCNTRKGTIVKTGDCRRNGTKYEFAMWQIGRCEDYDGKVGEQMRKTLAPLLDKMDLLNQIYDNHHVAFVLEIVPTIYVGDQNPCLAPPLDVIDFCHTTRTEIDIDMYVMDSA